MNIRRLLAWLCLVVVTVLPATGFTAGAAGAEDAEGARRPSRVVLFSLPRTTWAMLEAYEHPNLDRLLDRSVAANLSPRTATARSSMENGYATIGAGNRADGGPLGAAAFNRTEEVDNSTACETYRRRTGGSCDGDILHLGIVGTVDANKRRHFDAVPGVLGSTLADAGLKVAAFGNADGPVLTDDRRRQVADEPSGASDFQAETPTEAGEAPELQLGRSVVLAAMNQAGVVRSGSVSESSLLVDDPRYPYGVRLSIRKVMRGVGEVLGDVSLLVVEASDLERVDRAKVLATPEQHERLLGLAMTNADSLLGELLRVAPLDDTLYVVASPAAPRGSEQFTIFAMAGPGADSGVATTASTGRDGYVTLPAIAPTILDALSIEVPTEVVGSAIMSAGGAWSYERFIEDNQEGVAGEALRPPLFWTFVLATLALYVAAAIYFWHRRGRSTVFAFCALWMLYVPVCMSLLQLFAFGTWASAVSIVVIGALALVLAAMTWPLRHRRPAGPVVAAITITMVVQLVDLVFGAHLELNSALGYSTINAGRFAGAGNLPWALSATAAIFIAAFMFSVWGRGRWQMACVAALFIVVTVLNGAPMWGANIGSMLTNVPGFIVAFMLLTGRRIRPVWIAAAAGLTVVVVGGFALVDLSRPAAEQTHLAGAVHRYIDSGWGGFWTIVLRKIDANLSIIGRSPVIWIVPFSAAFLVSLGVQRPGLSRMIDRRPLLRPALWSVLVTGLLAMATNDTGIAIPAIMLGIVAPLLLYLRATDEWTDEDGIDPTACAQGVFSSKVGTVGQAAV